MSFMTKPPFAFSAVGEPASILAKGGFFISKNFYFQKHAGFLWLKLQQNPRATRVRLKT
jgi:hypothetical protein